LGRREDYIWGWLVVNILYFFHQQCVVRMGFNPILPTVAKIVKRMSIKKNINYYVWTATGLKLCCVFEVPRLSTTNGKKICRKPGSRTS